MRILFLNWRDITNPKGGGAERVTHEICKYLVNQGHEVTLFTASYPGARAQETLDGVRIIREGSQITVHLKAYLRYKKEFQGKVDLVIDEVNTIPFFTPLYVKEKKLAYFNQLARGVWFYEAPFPLSVIGYLIEPLYLKPYATTPTITICNSCKEELHKYGIKNVAVIPMAVDWDLEQKYIRTKETTPTLIFVARLVPSKKPVDAIKALAYAKKMIPDLKLWLVGGGTDTYITKLRNLVNKLNLADSVEFKGRVSNEEKFTLMSKAHIILVTSIKEGWGLIITEANAVKTPGIVYNVTGLRDAVKNKETGIVCTSNSPEHLSSQIVSLLQDKLSYETYTKNAYAWSKELTWEQTGKKTLEILERVMNG